MLKHIWRAIKEKQILIIHSLLAWDHRGSDWTRVTVSIPKCRVCTKRTYFVIWSSYYQRISLFSLKRVKASTSNCIFRGPQFLWPSISSREGSTNPSTTCVTLKQLQIKKIDLPYFNLADLLFKLISLSLPAMLPALLLLVDHYQEVLSLHLCSVMHLGSSPLF